MNGRHRLLLLLLCILYCGVTDIGSCAFADEEMERNVDAILEAVREKPRVKDILLDFPEIRMKPFYNERHDVWIIEFLHVDAGELGVVSVSPESGDILEFDIHIDRMTGSRERDADDEDQEGDEDGEQKISILSVLWRFRPRFEGPAIAWFSLILVALFAADFSRLFAKRNMDILLLYMLCPFLNIIWQDRKTAYTGIFIVTVMFFIRCLASVFSKPSEVLEKTVFQRRAMSLILALACLFHIQTTYEKGVDDSGIWSVNGAAYLAETGNLPYGTDFGWNCVYGPLMYFTHVPINMVFQPSVKFTENGGEANWGEYQEFETRGAKTMVLVFDFLAMLGLYCLGKKYSNESTGILLALIFALNPYILTLGGGFGLQQTSHMIGIPFVIFALVFITRPVIAGTLLGIACGIIYYPIFLFPLWIGFYVRTRSWKEAVRFLMPIVIIGCICLILIFTLTEPSPRNNDMSALQAFLNDTVYQQQFKDGYGTSSFSFWGQHPNIAKWGKSLVGVLYVVFCGLIGFIPIQMNMNRLVALTAAVLVGTQLVLSHGGGTYIGFYIAALIIVMFGNINSERIVNTPQEI